VPATALFGDFQEEVQKRTGVAPGEQRFSLDPQGQQAVSGTAASPLSQIGIVNGTQLHLVNKDATVAAQVLTKVPITVEPEVPVAKGTGGGGSAGSTASGSGSASSSSAAPGTSSSSGDGKKVDPKFETFDAFIRKRRYDTGALAGNQKYVTGRVQKGMIRLPPSVSIKQQPYRHIDTLSVINVPEIENFIGYWYGSLLENAMHRVGWMYGYYLEDNNYDEGTRAIMEGIYEPPQEMQGEMAHPKDDPHQARVDRIAESCGIERIGWIFTTLLLEDDTLLSPEEVLRIAGFQNETSSDQHFTKYRLSKFVSCAVRPDPAQGGQPGINPFMVSEQACAMLRDGILTSTPSDRRCCVVRDAKDKNEIIPEFLVEGKESKKIATDFFVVRVNDTAPKKHVRLFTHAEFPRENRQTHPQRREDLKKYFNKIPKSEPSWSRFADFHLILYIAQEIDVDTAVIIGNCVRDRTEIPEGIMMIINQLIQ